MVSFYWFLWGYYHSWGTLTGLLNSGIALIELSCGVPTLVFVLRYNDPSPLINNDWPFKCQNWQNLHNSCSYSLPNYCNRSPNLTLSKWPLVLCKKKSVHLWHIVNPLPSKMISK